MNVLWTIGDMAAAMAAEARGDMPDAITGISIDSRSLTAGEAYFAIKGDVHDGHKFVAGAAANGAAVSVVARGWLDRLEGETGALLIVDDVLSALERLGRAARARTGGKVIAITGSVGKTTTKEALRIALAPSGTVHASVASFNNHWGVPLTLARMPAETAFGVFEIGMNHPGEIVPLVDMVAPDIAMVMNVAAVHLGAFASVDEIARAKAEIFTGLDGTGVAIINADDERADMLRDFALAEGVTEIVTFGEAENADARIERLAEKSDCSCLTADILGQPITLKVGTPGRHIVQNVMGVLAACRLTGADMALAGMALADLGAVKGRGQRHTLHVTGGEALLIDESYNANPTSQRAALTMLGAAELPAPRGRRIAVLGDMLELGERSAELHAGLADAVRANADIAYLVGTEMTALAAALKGDMQVVHLADAAGLAAALSTQLRGGDVVMAKASLSLKFGPVVQELLDTYGRHVA